MKMAFLPGKLFLESRDDGTFELRFGEQVRTLRSQKEAVAVFRELRAVLEKDFPPRELSAEERRVILRQDIVDAAVRHNSLRNAGPRKKMGTRTFG